MYYFYLISLPVCSRSLVDGSILPEIAQFCPTSLILNNYILFYLLRNSGYYTSITRIEYRKSYCSHPGVGVSVGVAQMLKFLVKVFMRLYLLNMLMDRVDTLYIDRYWSEVLCCTIMTHLSDLEVKVSELVILC